MGDGGRRRLTLAPPAWRPGISGSRFACLGGLLDEPSGQEDLGSDHIAVQVAVSAMDEEMAPRPESPVVRRPPRLDTELLQEFRDDAGFPAPASRIWERVSPASYVVSFHDRLHCRHFFDFVNAFVSLTSSKIGSVSVFVPFKFVIIPISVASGRAKFFASNCAAVGPHCRICGRVATAFVDGGCAASTAAGSDSSASAAHAAGTSALRHELGDGSRSRNGDAVPGGSYGWWGSVHGCPKPYSFSPVAATFQAARAAGVHAYAVATSSGPALGIHATSGYPCISAVSASANPSAGGCHRSECVAQ
ncbi:hypothetical protein ACQ4PT_048007 [Festuca glaucescens]